MQTVNRTFLLQGTIVCDANESWFDTSGKIENMLLSAPDAANAMIDVSTVKVIREELIVTTTNTQ